MSGSARLRPWEFLRPRPGEAGSGVPLTAENIAAVVISVLATESLSEIDKTIVDLCNARPVGVFADAKSWRASGSPTFKTEVGRVLTAERLASSTDLPVSSISVARPWRGRIVVAADESIDFSAYKSRPFFTDPIIINAEIDYETLGRLIDFTSGALSQLAEEEDDE
jgi:hypothetical protein